MLEFQALAKFYKPSLVQFSRFALTVVKVNNRTALATKRYFSARFQHTAVVHCYNHQKHSEQDQVNNQNNSFFKQILLDAVINLVCYIALSICVC